MADRVFFLDYAPLLSAKKQRVAVLLYLVYDKFSDNRGYVALTYQDLHSGFGFSSRIIAEADQVLQDYKLISIPGTSELEKVGIKARGKVRRVLPLSFMDETEREKHFAEVKLPVDSSFRMKFGRLHVEFPEYQRLIDLSSLEEAYRKLGSDIATVGRLARYLGLDPKLAKLAFEDKEFKKHSQDTIKLAIRNVDGKKAFAPVQKPKKNKQPAKTVSEQYKQLMEEGHLTRKKTGETQREIPLEEWKSKQILRYFCLQYFERYEIAYSFSASPFRGREIRECKRLLGVFDPPQAKAYIDWLFKREKDVTSTAVLLYPNVMNVYRRACLKNIDATERGVKKVPQKFLEWLEAEYPTFTDDNSVETVVDLQWLKKLVDQKVSDPIMEVVVAKAITMGLL